MSEPYQDDMTPEQLVNQFHPDEWWHHDGGEDYVRLAAKLLSFGLAGTDIVDILGTAYWAAAGEYGA
jgi:hypothetical protein